MNSSKHQLRVGTILEDRYVIKSVLGEGGFGITYAAYDGHIHGMVAVKELYIRKYLDRDPAVSDVVSLKDETYAGAFSVARDAFINEARILGMFNSDAAIVSISDFFQANETAYLVMNYLEGITLAEYIETRGCLADQIIFEKLLPVLRVLGKVHEAGILHCDISPDNLMVMPDGSLCLIDFGASQRMSQKLDVKFIKDGYAPIERWTNEEHGPWTDIYALSATAYYCITGRAPECAVSRACLDEVKRPSEMNITVNFVLENIMMKGMEVACEDRYQSCRDMEEAMQAVFAPPVPYRSHLWKYLLIGGLSAALCTGIVVGYNKWNSYKESIKFKGIDTETVLLVPQQAMTAADYQNAKRIVEKRVRTLAGEHPYRMEENQDGNLTVTLPCSVFGEKGVEATYEQLILTPGDIIINSGLVIGENYVNYSLNREDIQKLELKQDITGLYDIYEFSEEDYQNYQYIEIEVSKDASQKIWDTLSEKFQADSVWISVYPTAGYRLIPGKDKQTFYIIGFQQEENFPELIKCILENNSFEKDIHVYRYVTTDWEERGKSDYWGEFQCEADEIEAPYTILAYNRLSDDTTKGEWLVSIQCVKQRLDLCEIPYALGFSGEKECPFALKIRSENYSDLLADTLTNVGADLCDGWESNRFSYDTGDVFLEAADDGTCRLTVQTDGYDQEKLADFTEDMLNRGLKKLYLKADDYYIASMEIDAPVSDGRLVFDRLCIEEFTQITEQNRGAAEYFCEILSQKVPASYSLQTTMFVDEEGNVVHENPTDEFWHVLEPLDEIKQKVQAIYPSANVWSEKIHLYIILELSITPDIIDQYLSAVKTIYEECSLDEGYYDSIYFLPFAEDDAVVERARMTFRKAYTEAGPGYEVSIFFINGRCDGYGEKLKEKMSDDSFFQKFITDSTFENPLYGITH